MLGIAAACLTLGASARATGSPPLLGVNYAHFTLDGCDFLGHGILRDGGAHRALISDQLAAMRAAGVQSLRMIIWNMHDSTGQEWGVVDSAGGRLAAVPRANLIAYLQAARKDGFKQVTVSFGPVWTNDPLEDNYDPSLFDENWHFIQDVRGIVERYGPSGPHFDLLNEGAPAGFGAQATRVDDYLTRMYSNYVGAYGNGDVTVSSIAGPPFDATRLINLVDALRASGKPLPTWFEVHTYSSTNLDDLQSVDSWLTALSVSAPITLGETYDDDAQAAAAVKSFVDTSARGLLEALSWPFERGSACDHGVSPPYRVDAMTQALTGAPPDSTLTAVAAVSGASLRTADGDKVTALEGGDWTVSVDVQDSHTRFTLTGPGIDQSTSPGFVGEVEWHVTLQPGTYAYRRVGRPGWSRGGTFRVLAAG